ncbi:MAG TPA: hypothetical protein VHK24_05880 [Steroidobacter sp.]|jgi:uncharacterized membrane protein|nr:hypothetical protein [Steroidobacter sp.]
MQHKELIVTRVTVSFAYVNDRNEVAHGEKNVMMRPFFVASVAVTSALLSSVAGADGLSHVKRPLITVADGLSHVKRPLLADGLSHVKRPLVAIA